MPLFRTARPLNYPPTRDPQAPTEKELRGIGSRRRRDPSASGVTDGQRIGPRKSTASSTTNVTGTRKASGLFRRNSLSSINSHSRNSNAGSIRRSLSSLFPAAVDERPRPAQSPIYAGYLAKRGRRSSRLIMRYFVLTGSVLSNHLDDKSPASWMISILGAQVDERESRLDDPEEGNLALPKNPAGTPHQLLTVTLRLRGIVIDLFAQSVVEADAWTRALVEASTIKPVRGHIAAMPPNSRPRLLRTLSGRNLTSPMYYANLDANTDQNQDTADPNEEIANNNPNAADDKDSEQEEPMETLLTLDSDEMHAAEVAANAVAGDLRSNFARLEIGDGEGTLETARRQLTNTPSPFENTVDP